MADRTLIRNASVLTVDPALGTLPGGDILVEDDRIVAVGPSIEAGDAHVIEADGMIAMPGLVCCHRHLWMTLMRGFASDSPWSKYLVEIYWGQRPFYGPDDIHAATSAGALDAIDCGVTTVLDFNDCSVREGNADSSLDALEATGLRAVYAYGVEGAPEIPSGRKPTGDDLNPSHDWHRAEARRLRSGRLAGDDNLVTMGITTRNLELLPETCMDTDLGLARELGVRTVTMHAGLGALSRGVPFIETLRRKGHLGPDLLFSHGQSFTDDELDVLADHGVKIVVSVESELGQGADPVTWRAIQHGVDISLGADSVGSLSGDMFRHMQFTLKVGRGSRARLLEAQGQAPTDVALTTEDMLEIGTMGGARALRMEDRIGSLTPGKQADLILLRRDRIGLASGADPSAVAVLQAHAGDVDTVMIAGRVLKRDGVLVGVDASAVHRNLEAALERVRSEASRHDLGPLRQAFAALHA